MNLWKAGPVSQMQLSATQASALAVTTLLVILVAYYAPHTAVLMMCIDITGSLYMYLDHNTLAHVLAENTHVGTHCTCTEWLACDSQRHKAPAVSGQRLSWAHRKPLMTVALSHMHMYMYMYTCTCALLN